MTVPVEKRLRDMRRKDEDDKELEVRLSQRVEALVQHRCGLLSKTVHNWHTYLCVVGILKLVLDITIYVVPRRHVFEIFL